MRVSREHTRQLATRCSLYENITLRIGMKHQTIYMYRASGRNVQIFFVVIYVVCILYHHTTNLYSLSGCR